jgi:Flp pilus assembly protein TadD
MARNSKVFRTAGILALLLSAGGCGLLGGDDKVASERLRLGDVALQEGMSDLSLSLAEDTLQQSPSNLRAMELKADALLALGRRDDAITAFQAVLTKDPGSVRANTGMGKLQLRANPAAAADYFERGLKTDPKNIVLLNDLGVSLDLLNRHAEAQDAYRRALAIRPDDTPTTVDLALSLAMSGQPAAALALIQPVAARPDATPEVKHNYAIVLAWAGRRTEAEQILAADLPPDAVKSTLARIPAGGARVQAVQPRGPAVQTEKLSTSAPVPLQSGTSNGRGGS